METTKEHLDLFKKECLRLQKKWGLTGWELYFFRSELDEENFAQLHADPCGRVVRADLALNWPASEIIEKEIKNAAKHEMLHLIISRLDAIGRTRFVSETEADEAREEVVRILEKIVK